MKYKIIGDSCCDISKANDVYGKVEIVPLTLSLEGKEYVDDETFNQKEFIDHVAAAKDYARSACPSPQRYMEAYEGDYDCVFVVTLSGNLSGSYNSAMTGMKMYYEENPGDGKKIHVFDSIIAIAVAILIIKEAYELIKNGFDEIIDRRLSDEEENEIRQVIEKHKEEFENYHKLKTRKSGNTKHADFHITVKSDMTVKEAHDIIGNIKKDMNDKFKSIRITIHVDPK
jgi:DegV family protein with EDD domain